MKLFPENPMEDIYGIADILKPEPLPDGNVALATVSQKPFSKEEAEIHLAALKKSVSACKNCVLATTRTNVVFGEGDPKARLMFIGEGPGADEDASGRPFIGKAGQLLTKMIIAMGLKREDVYIANIVKCRPPENRNPDSAEAAACIGYLKEQIKFINPEFIVCLGSVAVTHLFNTSIKITQVRGTWKTFCGCKVMLTYHPSFLLRSPGRKKEAWLDLQLVMEAMTTKEKQVEG